MTALLLLNRVCLRLADTIFHMAVGRNKWDTMFPPTCNRADESWITHLVQVLRKVCTLEALMQKKDLNIRLKCSFCFKVHHPHFPIVPITGKNCLLRKAPLSVLKVTRDSLGYQLICLFTALKLNTLVDKTNFKLFSPRCCRCGFTFPSKDFDSEMNHIMKEFIRADSVIYSSSIKQMNDSQSRNKSQESDST